MNYTSEKVKSMLICIRHGKAAYTYEEDHGGDIVEGSLIDVGKKTISKSSEEICSILEKNSYSNIQLVSSPKNRCVESADILEEVLINHGVAVDRKSNAGLRDVRVIGPTESRAGSYTRWETDMKEGENWFSSWLRKTGEGMEFYPGEESPVDIQKRVSEILPVYAQSHIPVILMCHEEIFQAVATELDLPWTFPDYGEVWYIQHTI